MNFKFNTTSTFLFPLIDNRYSLWSKYLNNCFLGTKEEGFIPLKIIVVFKFNGNKEYADLIKSYQSISSFEKMEHLDKYDILYFNIPDSLIKEYELFLMGKYSLFSKESKDRILKNTETNILHWIFNKHPLYKKRLEDFLDCVIDDSNELHSVVDVDKEVLDISLLSDTSNTINKSLVDFWK